MSAINYAYDLNEIKEAITEEQVFQLLEEFGAEPRIEKNAIICKTICHNHCGYGSHKLYYYLNSQLFKCYTECAGEVFDIFELTKKVLSREHPKAGQKNGEWTLPEVIQYIAQKFHFSMTLQEDFDSSFESKEDFLLFEKYNRIKNINAKTEEIVLKEYDGNFLKNLPHPIILPWIQDNITKEIMDYYEICYNPKSQGIVIPHRDINGRLIGIRERTLIKENIELYGKYRPAYIKNQLYNHPLSYNLYGLYQNKENIKNFKKVFLFESEKSVLQYASMFGQENNLSVAVTGSNLLKYQFFLLMSLGIREVIISFDKQYKAVGDEEYKRWVKKLKSISRKYSPYCKISFLFDTENLLGYKDSPTDKGEEVFLALYNNKLDSKGKR